MIPHAKDRRETKSIVNASHEPDRSDVDLPLYPILLIYVEVAVVPQSSEQ